MAKAANIKIKLLSTADHDLTRSEFCAGRPITET